MPWRNKLLLWSVVMLGLYGLLPRLFRASLVVTEHLLAEHLLAKWNGGNWIGIFCAVMVCAGVVAAVLEFMPQLLQMTHRAEAWDWLRLGLTRPLFGLVVWLAVLLLGPLLIPNLAPPLAFIIASYLAALIGAQGLIPAPQPRPDAIRGKPLASPKRIRAKWKKQPTRHLIPWGAGFVKKRNEALHFFLLGNTGGGKSTFMQVMMTRTLAGIGFDPNIRAIVVDPKQNIVPFLEALGLGSGITGDDKFYVILNPLDKRCARWAIGRDINTPGRAAEFARIIIGQADGDNRFFYETAVSMVAAVVVALQSAMGAQWRLRDLLNAFSNPTTTYQLLKKWHPRPDSFDDFFKTKKGERNDIFTTVRSELDKYSLVAALWERATEEFTIQEWNRGEFVLVLGSDYEYPDTLKTINNLLFTLISAYLKNLPDDPQRRVWVYFDEIRAIGEVIGILSTLELGRSKSVCMGLATQNMAGFIEEYGENVAKSILGLCRHKALFPMDSDSARFMSDAIGSYEGMDVGLSSSQSVLGENSQTYSYQSRERRTVLAQELDDRNLPEPGPENGLMGYFISPGEGIHFHTYSWEQIQGWRPEPLADVVAYDRVDERYVPTIPLPWNQAERDALNLQDEPEAPQSRKTSSKEPSRPKPPPPIKRNPRA